MKNLIRVLVIVSLFVINTSVIYAADESAEYLARAKKYYSQGLLDNAEKEAKKALEISPNNADAHMGLGTIYTDKKLFDEAISEFKTVIKLYPNNTESYVWLGTVYRLKGEYDNAVVHLNKAIEITPNYDKAHYILGITYLDKGDTTAALKQYDILKKLNPQIANMLIEKINGTPYHKGGTE